MENYIINPSWFYWTNVLRNLGSLLMAVGVGLILVIGIIVIIDLCNYENCWGDDERKKYSLLVRKHLKLLIIPLIMCAITVLIPDEKTMYQMMIARYCTYENVSLSIEAIQKAVDYIVEKFSVL